MGRKNTSMGEFYKLGSFIGRRDDHGKLLGRILFEKLEYLGEDVSEEMEGDASAWLCILAIDKDELVDALNSFFA